VKITKSQLKQIIKEELGATMDEGFLDMLGLGSYEPELSDDERANQLDAKRQELEDEKTRALEQKYSVKISCGDAESSDGDCNHWVVRDYEGEIILDLRYYDLDGVEHALKQKRQDDIATQDRRRRPKVREPWQDDPIHPDSAIGRLQRSPSNIRIKPN
tara:strand:- start:73 stop:549 length:477 start_codon:yes stop_codon:yes gene_type:complete